MKFIDAVNFILRDISRLLMCCNTKTVGAHLQSTKALFYFKQHFFLFREMCIFVARFRITYL